MRQTVPSLKLKKKTQKKRSLSPSEDVELANALSYPNPDFIIGLDEVGRGCLAGPVFSGGFVYASIDREQIAQETSEVRVIDSKMLDAPERKASESILQNLRSKGLSSVQQATVAEIDSVNIHHASLLAMSRAFDDLVEKFQISENHRLLILVDGSFVPKQILSRPEVKNGKWKAASLTKGDGRSFAIAGAAIVAKEARDRLMRQLAEVYPDYHWEKNVGYPTPDHRIALTKIGDTAWHRKTFKWQALEEVSEESSADLQG
jgi:ribonuclease HII